MRSEKLKRKKNDVEGVQEPPAAPPAPEESPVESSQPRSFEDAFGIVEKAVERLERGDLSLEESLAEYESGLKSLKRCYEILSRAQRRIEVLSGEVGGMVEKTSGPEGNPGPGERTPDWKPGTSHPGLKEALEQVEREEELPRGP